MASDVPAFLEVGTPVSAKFKGAFCEATIKSVKKLVKFKVQYKDGTGSSVVQDDTIEGEYKLGSLVLVKQDDGEKKPATIQKMNDHSYYTVVFDDGDERTLKRTNVVVMGERHFLEHENLDNLPLTDPENFLSPVVLSSEKRRKRRRSAANLEEEDSDSDNKRELHKEFLGKVVCIEVGDRKRSWFPALGVKHHGSHSESQVFVQSFKDGKRTLVNRDDVKEFSKTRDPLQSFLKGESRPDPVLKSAVEKAVAYKDMGELPKGWNILDTIDEKEESSDEDLPSTPVLSAEDKSFHETLYSFLSKQGTNISKPPFVNNQGVNLHKFYKLVQEEYGGMDDITNQQWRSIYKQLGLRNIHTTASFNMKNLYKKYLQPWEENEKTRSSPRLQEQNNAKRKRKSGTAAALKDEADRLSTKSESDSEPERRRSTRGATRAATMEKTPELAANERKRRSNVTTPLESSSLSDVDKEDSKESIKKEKEETKKFDSKLSELEDVDVINSPQSSITSDGTTENNASVEGDEHETVDEKKFGKYKMGCKISVRYGNGKNQRTYTAKILDMEKDDRGDVLYYVHYNGWNHRHDEWIREEVIFDVVGPSTSKRKNPNPPTSLSKITKDPPHRFKAKLESESKTSSSSSSNTTSTPSVSTTATVTSTSATTLGKTPTEKDSSPKDKSPKTTAPAIATSSTTAVQSTTTSTTSSSRSPVSSSPKTSPLVSTTQTTTITVTTKKVTSSQIQTPVPVTSPKAESETPSKDSKESPSQLSKQSPASAKQAPASAKQTPVSAKQTPVSSKQTPASTKQTPVSAKQTASTKQTPTPKSQAITPATKQTPILSKQTPTQNKQQTPAQVNKATPVSSKPPLASKLISLSGKQPSPATNKESPTTSKTLSVLSSKASLESKSTAIVNKLTTSSAPLKLSSLQTKQTPLSSKPLKIPPSEPLTIKCGKGYGANQQEKLPSPLKSPAIPPDAVFLSEPSQHAKGAHHKHAHHRPKPVNDVLFIPDIKPSPVKPRLTRNSMQDTFLLNALEQSIGGQTSTVSQDVAMKSEPPVLSRRRSNRQNPSPKSNEQHTDSDISSKEESKESAGVEKDVPEKRISRADRKNAELDSAAAGLLSLDSKDTLMSMSKDEKVKNWIEDSKNVLSTVTGKTEEVDEEEIKSEQTSKAAETSSVASTAVTAATPHEEKTWRRGRRPKSKRANNESKKKKEESDSDTEMKSEGDEQTNPATGQIENNNVITEKDRTSETVDALSAFCSIVENAQKLQSHPSVESTASTLESAGDTSPTKDHPGVSGHHLTEKKKRSHKRKRTQSTTEGGTGDDALKSPKEKREKQMSPPLEYNSDFVSDLADVLSEKSSVDRIAIMQSRLNQMRKLYCKLRQEVASIDRRKRRKLRKQNAKS
ncbi:AT-rich interactive domain-containing protein 4B-like [Clytia hemisphaerica]|uniref:ARID domain-containing protein n=1 Tax=Clytia hemisphaerica TaxID=252671 RepID=A0A7M5WZ39_9CNID